MSAPKMSNVKVSLLSAVLGPPRQYPASAANQTPPTIFCNRLAKSLAEM